MLGIRQAVRHRTLTPAYGSPNLPSPANNFHFDSSFQMPCGEGKISANMGEARL